MGHLWPTQGTPTDSSTLISLGLWRRAQGLPNLASEMHGPCTPVSVTVCAPASPRQQGEGQAAPTPVLPFQHPHTLSSGLLERLLATVVFFL